MKLSRMLAGAATVALGSMLAWGAVPGAAMSTTARAPQMRRGPQGTPAERAKMATDRLDKALTAKDASLALTDDQKPKVEAIYEKQFTAMDNARQSGDMSQMRSMMMSSRKELAAVLTPEQVKAMPTPRGRRGPGGGK